MNSFISAKNVSKRYGKKLAFDNASFELGAGEVVGLIGPNGAGKSTLLKSILGLIRYDGELTVLGYSPRSDRSSILESLSYIADVASLPDWISVKRLYDYMEGVHEKFDRRKSLDYLEKTSVTLSHKVKALSKGMKTQLHLALIMGIDTKLLVLDEPTLGLDVLFRTEFYDTLANDYMSPERSILVTTHQVEEIEDYLTRVMFINNGAIIFDMSREQIKNDFLKLTVEGDQSTVIAGPQPIDSRIMGGKQTLIFENASRDELVKLGEVSTPGLAELFVAKVRGGQ